MVSKTTILPWLIKRIEAKTHDGNRVYAAEILSILLDNRPNRLAFGKVNGVESALTVLSVSANIMNLEIESSLSVLPIAINQSIKTPSQVNKKSTSTY